MEQTRNLVTRQGVVVNGLPVMDESANGYFPNLDRYYQACVAGGRGAFIVVVRSYRDFASAMRRKLILEISQNNGRKPDAREDFAQNSLLRRVATARPHRCRLRFCCARYATNTRTIAMLRTPLFAKRAR